MRFHAFAFGLAAGILGGIYIFVATVAAAAGWTELGEVLQLFVGIAPGYEISVLGATIGAVYGLIEGFVLGALFAVLHNFFEAHLPHHEA